MRSFGGALQAILNALGQPTFACLVSFETLGTNYTNWAAGITFGGTTYTAARFVVEGLSENFLTEAPAATLKITSLDASTQALFFADSFRGETVTIRIVYLASGTWTDTTFSIVLTADSDETDADAVTVRLASSDAVDGTDVPRRATQEAGCQHDYRRGGCPYRGGLQSCAKTLLDCRAHFPDMDLERGTPWTTSSGTANHTRIVQPLPYGAFVGGLTQRLVVG